MVIFISLFKVKYVDSNNEKVDFYIKLKLKYIDDESFLKSIELDLTINQFYSIFNDFQKIETMITTLV